ncbi:hypothetical protein [Sutterella wadsworthensis]|uniref:hypothetical protein n=1 Tax=Sutterella wadsworthensis TaxID=40545 RepID=UPI003AB919AA
MEVIIPQPLKILSSTVAEDEAAQWSETATYASGDKVIYDHYVYLAVDAVPAAKKPADNCDADGMPWRTVGVTNKYACIDIYSYTQTKAPGQAVLTVQVPIVAPATAVALLNMQAVRATVSVHTAGGELVYGGEPIDLLRDSANAWEYWFGAFRFQRDLLLTNIPPATGTVTVALEHGTCPALGMLLVGERVIFGDTQYGARSGFISYSKTAVDDYGTEAWTKRGTARRGTFPVWIDPQDADYVEDILMDLDGEPALWVAGAARALMVFGFLKEFDDGWETYGKNIANFEVRGIR